MPGKLFVLIDHGQETIRNSSWETLALAQKLALDWGKEVHALLLGREVASLADRVKGKAVESVLVVDDERLAEYDPDAHAHALKQILERESPQALLMGHTYQNIDLAPKLAASMGRGLVTDCIGYRMRGDDLIFTRQMFRNKLNADVRLRSEFPWIVTIQSGAVSADELREGEGAEIRMEPVDLDGVERRRVQLEAFEAGRGKVDLTKADIIVGVGRGIKKEENLSIVRDLAEALGAEIGASRPVVDNEWMARERQIGSSGQNVSPKLYIACGISGAVQHIVGMKGSGCIVSINSDPNAPIFNISNYGIVGDVMEIVPALTKKLGESQG